MIDTGGAPSPTLEAVIITITRTTGIVTLAETTITTTNVGVMRVAVVKITGF